jgi:quinol monooxygenase YgiN
MVYAVVARYECAPGDADTVRSALLRMRELTRQEPGNLDYVVHQDTESPSTFLLYEQYADRAGFDAHAASAHFAEHIVGTVRPLLTERTVFFAEPLA